MIAESFTMNALNGHAVNLKECEDGSFDCLMTVSRNGSVLNTVRIPSSEIIEFVCWVLPQRAHDILRENGLQLAKVR